MSSLNGMFTIPDLSRRESETVGARPQVVRFQDKYRMRSDLGKGGFGTVKSCLCHHDGAEYAVKVVDKAGAGGSGVHHEVEILQLLRNAHPNFVQLIETFDTRGRLYIVMEMVHGGMLLRQIERSNTFSEATARRMVSQLLVAVEFMHGKGIVHRDLKPANLLLTESNIDATIKICDFGFARLVGEDPTITGRTGTLLFMAPEVVQSSLNVSAYGKPVDMWSLGVIFYIMLSGAPPFTGAAASGGGCSGGGGGGGVAEARSGANAQAPNDPHHPPRHAAASSRYRQLSRLKCAAAGKGGAATQLPPPSSSSPGEEASPPPPVVATATTTTTTPASRLQDERRLISQQIVGAEVVFAGGTVWDSVSSGCKDLIRRLLLKCPRDRITASEALAHGWVRDGGCGAAGLSTRNLMHERGQFNDLPSLRAAALAVVALHRLVCGVRAPPLRTLPVCRSLRLLLSNVLRLRPLSPDDSDVDVTDNTGSSSAVSAVAEFLRSDASGRRVAAVDAAATGVGDGEAAVLLAALAGHEAVTHVDLSGNAALTRASEDALVRVASSAPLLRRIDLSGTALGSRAVARVVEAAREAAAQRQEQEQQLSSPPPPPPPPPP
eukprot:Rhum_TRINITY_DN14767_c15_g1::Rhum_TRINITY_DN14767_c15_g1_i1::g.116872::m.116872/K04372/MKNK, MNK; MAP kinase interacting serine/threonine kinase